MEEMKMDISSFKDGFFTSTGLQPKDHPDLYIQYIQARSLLTIANIIIDIRNNLKANQERR